MLRRLLFSLALFASVVAQPAVAATSGDGERLLGPNGAALFIVGMNYEGAADRAWQMWDNDKFDARAIDADFTRAAMAGITTVRIFVQAPLAVDVAAGKFDKLDQTVVLAEKHALQLIVSLHDYGERDLARIAGTAGKIAQRYRGRPGVLAFDIKNEPRFGDLALTKYSTPPPLQTGALIDALGERLPHDQLAAYRATDDGTKTIPSYLNDGEAWAYINNLRLYREMLAEAASWVRDHNFQTTTLDYLDDPAGQKWAPMVKGLNQTLAAWLGPQVQAIRAGDPTRPITVDHVDAVLAKLPANDVLDYQSLHRYPGTGAASIRSNLNLLAGLERAHSGKPYLLSEFGYATQTVDPELASLNETAIMLGLLAQHAAGGVKWMLNDMPDGFNMRERTLGAFRLDGSPKPIVGALAALHAYVSATGSAPGDFRLENDPDTMLRYAYTAADAVWLGGKHVDSTPASMDADGPAQLAVSWSQPGIVRLWASTSVQATLDLSQVVGGTGPGSLTLARIDLDGKEQPVAPGSRTGNSVKLALQAGSYVLRAGPPQSRGPDYDIAGGHFFTQTNGRKDSGSGFAVTDDGGVPFWSAFQALGGADVLGYPVTRRFELDGFAVQGFQKTVLQWHPDQHAFSFLNTFDVLHDRGRDDWLEVYRQTPRPLDTAPDAGLPWPQVVARHVALLDKAPAPLKQRFFADAQWLDHFGLPVSTQEFPSSIVVRAQRATLQYWKEAVPWAARGSVSVANGGDLAKEAGLFPWLAVTPEQRVALIVTVLDEARTVDGLLDSIAHQTRAPDEIVIVDGGSTDGTWAILQTWTPRLPVHCLRAPGAGIARGRNLAIEAATSEVIAVTDAGVRLEPDWLARLLSALGVDVDVVSGFFRADASTTFERAMGATVLPVVEDVDGASFLPSSRSVLFRRAAWASIGGYPAWLDYCEDLVFDLNLKRAGFRFAFAPAAVAWFRPRGSPGAFFRQYYLYARGDGKANLFARRHLIRYATYAVAAGLVWRRGWLSWLLLLLGAGAYTRRPYARLWPHVRELSPAQAVSPLALVPVIRLVGDVAKMLGYPVGVLWRLRRAWTCRS